MNLDKFTWKECKTYLDKLGSFRDGQTKRTFHCKRGKDNDRLFITKRGSCYLFYCHHCSKRGYYKPHGMENIETVKRKVRGFTDAERSCNLSTRIQRSTPSLPTDCIGWERKTDWSIQARVWLNKYALSDYELIKNGVQYSASRGRIYFPTSYGSELIGFAARRIEADGPKWLTLYKDKDRFFVYHNKSTDTCVIVEDRVSGILCARHLSCLVLSGTYLPDYAINKIKHHNKFLVFLDDDNKQVKLNQLKIKKQLGLFGQVKIVHAGTDPKNLEATELKELLDGK